MNRHHEPEFHAEDRKTALALQVFAEKNQITEDRVWEMIEEGVVSARFVNDSILILRDAGPAFESDYQLPEISVEGPPMESPAPPLDREVPPLETQSGKNAAATEVNPVKTLPETTAKPREMRSFKSALSTASFEEPEDDEAEARAHKKSAAASKLPEFDGSHELILFAQDALSRTAELSHQLLATKDELLRMKEERIVWLTQLVQQKDREIRNLSRQLEEATILNKFERNERS